MFLAASLTTVACMQVSLRVNLAGFSILTVTSLILISPFFLVLAVIEDRKISKIGE